MRSQWVANLIHTLQVTMTKNGLVTKCKKKPNRANLELAHFLLAVPHHQRLENYSRQDGISSKGIKHISAGKIDVKEILEMLKKVSSKAGSKVKDYTEISITTRA